MAAVRAAGRVSQPARSAQAVRNMSCAAVAVHAAIAHEQRLWHGSAAGRQTTDQARIARLHVWSEGKAAFTCVPYVRRVTPPADEHIRRADMHTHSRCSDQTGSSRGVRQAESRCGVRPRGHVASLHRFGAVPRSVAATQPAITCRRQVTAPPLPCRLGPTLRRASAHQNGRRRKVRVAASWICNTHAQCCQWHTRTKWRPPDADVQ